jgi:hypothetical protein
VGRAFLLPRVSNLRRQLVDGGRDRDRERSEHTGEKASAELSTRLTDDLSDSPTSAGSPRHQRSTRHPQRSGRPQQEKSAADRARMTLALRLFAPFNVPGACLLDVNILHARHVDTSSRRVFGARR